MSSDSARGFGFPHHRYRGQGGLYEMTLSSNISEHSNEVQIIANLVIGGKIDPEDGFDQIKRHYKKLKKSHKRLKRSYYEGRRRA